MNTRCYRSFSTELLKISADMWSPDAYEHMSKLSVSSLGAIQFSGSPLSKNVVSEGPEGYQNKRDWAITGLKGSLGGVAGISLIKSIRDAKSRLTTGHVRAGAATGLALSVGDRLLRQHAERVREAKIKTAFVDPKPGPFRSPAKELATTSQTGKFRPEIVHKSPRHKDVQIGRRHRLPPVL